MSTANAQELSLSTSIVNGIQQIPMAQLSSGVVETFNAFCSTETRWFGCYMGRNDRGGDSNQYHLL